MLSRFAKIDRVYLTFYTYQCKNYSWKSSAKFESIFKKYIEVLNTSLQASVGIKFSKFVQVLNFCVDF